MRRQTFSAGCGHSPTHVPRESAPSPPRVRGLTPTPSPSALPPPPQPPAMPAEEEEWLVQAVMEDSEREYKRLQVDEWEGLLEMLELSASSDVYVPELDVKQEVKEEPTEERAWAPWSPPPSPLQPAHHSPVPFWEALPHLWMPPPFIDLTSDSEDGGA